jgi:predicted nuclease of predicted toxin-antitoxin system
VHFLIDANLPRSSAASLVALGHEVTDVRDIGLGTVDDSIIAEYAKSHGFALITRDRDFGDIRNYPPGAYHGIIVIDLPNDIAASVVVATLVGFVRRADLVDRLPGCLVIVESGRVRFRSGARPGK